MSSGLGLVLPAFALDDAEPGQARLPARTVRLAARGPRQGAREGYASSASPFPGCVARQRPGRARCPCLRGLSRPRMRLPGCGPVALSCARIKRCRRPGPGVAGAVRGPGGARRWRAGAPKRRLSAGIRGIIFGRRGTGRGGNGIGMTGIGREFVECALSARVAAVPGAATAADARPGRRAPGCGRSLDSGPGR